MSNLAYKIADDELKLNSRSAIFHNIVSAISSHFYKESRNAPVPTHLSEPAGLDVEPSGIGYLEILELRSGSKEISTTVSPKDLCPQKKGVRPTTEYWPDL